ncbi:diaminopimelate decarboxylase [Candidatus Vidania fulgoroideorum]
MKIENINIKKIIKNYKKPINIYSKKKILNNIKTIKKFKKISFYYAIKANNNKKILIILKNNNLNFEAVSIKEIETVLSIKTNPNRILFSGLGKSKEEIIMALKNDIKKFNVESVQEIKRIIFYCKKYNKRTNIFLRINLEIDCNSNSKISTGKKGSKFGLNIKEALEIKKILKKNKHSKITGIGFHLGSQILDCKYYIKAIKKIIKLKNKSFKNIKSINLGGGIGIDYNSNHKKNVRIKEYIIKKIYSKINNYKNIDFIMELGRSIIADTCITLFKVEYIKRNFIITDLGMNNIIRQVLYNSFHKIINLKKYKTIKRFNIVGPICECGDFLAKNILFYAKQNDFLIMKDTGAYCYSMSSTYNSRPKAKQILISNKKIIVLNK